MIDIWAVAKTESSEVVKNSIHIEHGVWQVIEKVSDKMYLAKEKKLLLFTFITGGDDANTY